MTVVHLVNPLPFTMRHYESEFVSLLSGVPGVQVQSVAGASGEMPEGAGRRLARVHSALQLLRRPSAIRHDAEAVVVVTWPIFGHYEPLMWARASTRQRIAVVIHDPTPLRASIGTGRGARAVGGLGARLRGLDIIVHSETARREVAGWGWPSPILLRHPVAPDGGPVRVDAEKRVVVLGQYKPTRDTRLLADLAPSLQDAGYALDIAGRGWPAIDGWHTESRTLDESELDALIDSATIVLIPYRHFYQSGIAVRALERGKPVVGPQHPFLADLYGAGWPGLVTGSVVTDWQAGIHAAAANLEAVAESRARYQRAALADWTSYLATGPSV